ncbi:Glycosyl hydrolase family 63 C-terminal domain-containing protein [Maribacter dokdonensis]|uniref:Glycosyl hydrolase family 63 C-terminal domain-containing protein n=2 Tax=Maribacter dokdonensis TaxID=320912 RepID=A0A1H4NWV0_9FLAO|nr:glucosidase [Maribacter dokdonensis]SEB99644.1 Glycosyl hydrolase family 63 C-terminal domain-containing protein [Maribacter dokdonensis]
MNNPEKIRLSQQQKEEKDWLKWGPYLSERQWGTVREDYSAGGDAWNYFPHDHARSRAFRWGEDGIAGISDRYCNMCFSIGLWNGKDPIIKERLFGLTGPQGNHGEDVKELYYYLENTPSHSYMKYLYKYSQKAYPYNELIAENQKRNRKELEYELLDTGIFDDNTYFDVSTEYAKGDETDILIKITITNRSNQAAPITLLPQMVMRNHWTFKEMSKKPVITKKGTKTNPFVHIDHPYVGSYNLYFQKAAQLFFTENETNRKKVYSDTNDHPYKKDLFNDAVCNNDFELATKNNSGTKFAPLYQEIIGGGESKTFQLRLTEETLDTPFSDFDAIFKARQEECAQFYEEIAPKATDDRKAILKQAFAGLLWTKQYYNYEVEKWLEGDYKTTPPAEQRKNGRNSYWKTLRNHDVLSMPDAWEYPWYAAWDSAFHCASFASIDPEFAKDQLLLFTKEWYMAPNGQIPAYEWNFSDVNPPVQAWATLQIYGTDKSITGVPDIKFLKRMFNKLSLNFNWWVNRQDRNDNNVFQGGFLGLDNIGVFDRSHGVPGGGFLDQVDGTAWMALYSLNMLEISLRIAEHDDTYEDMATKYFGHFVFIAEALNKMDTDKANVWDDVEGFFYDRLTLPNGQSTTIKVRSIAGMLSLAAVLTIKKSVLDKFPKFKASVLWFKKYRAENLKYEVIQQYEADGDLLLSLVPKDRMQKLVTALLDEKEFLSEYGIRSLSKVHEKAYQIHIDGIEYSIDYEPAESTVPLFGGNSNWRGPIWMPMNYLFIQALREYQWYDGNDFLFEYPTGSNKLLNLKQVSDELSKRLIHMFEKDEKGNRAINKNYEKYYQDPHFKDLILFYEYFHGENGRGLGASHQTGWTALVANLIEQLEE